MTDSLIGDIATAPQDVKFSVAVAAFAQKLKQVDQLSDFRCDEIRKLAADNRRADEFGYRSEFVRLVSLASSLPEWTSEQDRSTPIIGGGSTF